ncbi:hypothetical protein DFP72DRAFT_1133764 [Ephemerocybe angulata]|uniref:Uncharacterized protein n=1 Tax=Ephemerocybe angulata TaxID=980116 RepID=A0A8H6H7F7_9AGAR|nr:hypothetical protein DFP72DRAFT_1133764 [Tulosesus angulatus]
MEIGGATERIGTRWLRLIGTQPDWVLHNPQELSDLTSGQVTTTREGGRREGRGGAGKARCKRIDVRARGCAETILTRAKAVEARGKSTAQINGIEVRRGVMGGENFRLERDIRAKNEGAGAYLRPPTNMSDTEDPIDVDAAPRGTPASIQDFMIALLDRERVSFDRKLHNTLRQFNPGSHDGAAFHTVVGDLVRVLRATAVHPLILDLQYDSLRIRLALTAYGIVVATERRLQAELAAFVQRLSFVDSDDINLVARNEARTIAVSFLDHNTVRDLLRADQPSLSAATLDADVRTLLRWNNRYEMVLEDVEERGREVDGEGWINRFEQRMTRARLSVWFPIPLVRRTMMRGPWYRGFALDPTEESNFELRTRTRVPGGEVVILEGGPETLLVLLSRRETGLEEEVLDAAEIRLAPLQGYCTTRDEVFGGEEQSRGSVDVDFPEQGERGSDGGRDVDTHGVSDLTLVAGLDEPLHVLDEIRPPESREQTLRDREDALMPEVVMGFAQ